MAAQYATINDTQETLSDAYITPATVSDDCDYVEIYSFAEEPSSRQTILETPGYQRCHLDRSSSYTVYDIFHTNLGVTQADADYDDLEDPPLETTGPPLREEADYSTIPAVRPPFSNQSLPPPT